MPSGFQIFRRNAFLSLFLDMLSLDSSFFAIRKVKYGSRRKVYVKEV